jgi:hypothetical protein
MEALTQEAAAELWRRCDSFHDALLRSVECDYRGSGTLRATVTLSSQSGKLSSQWSNFTFSFEEVGEIMLAQRPRTTLVVLSFGLAIDWFDNQVFIAFSPYSPFTMASIDDYRKSEFYVAGAECYYEVSPYAE